MININILKENDYRIAFDCYTNSLSNDGSTKIENKLELLLNKINLGMNINKIVKTIRATIPKDEEDMLKICVSNPMSSYKANFMNGNLYGFEYVERVDITQ